MIKEKARYDAAIGKKNVPNDSIIEHMIGHTDKEKAKRYIYKAEHARASK